MKVKEIKIGNDVMKCYKLKNISERKAGNYNGLCMFGYFEDFSKEITNLGEWGYYKNGKRNGYVAIWNQEKGCTRGNYSNELKNGEIIYNFINGCMEKSNYKYGKKEGYSLYIWNDGGNEERYYSDGMKNGKAIRRFIKNCKEEIIYVNNVKHGKSVYYYSDGKYKERIHDNDRVIGNEVLYSKDGEFIAVIKAKEENDINIDEVKNMLKNLEKHYKDISNEISKIKKVMIESENINSINLNSEVKIKLNMIAIKENKSIEDIINKIIGEYDINLLLESINIKDEYGRKQGKWNENNKYEKEVGNYIDNIKDGEWITYNNIGEKVRIQKYKMGKLYGEQYFSETFYGNRKWEIDFEGKKQGEWIEDDMNYGYRIRVITNYKNDIKDGKFFSFYYNGNKCEEGYYKNGKKEGKYIRYNNDTGEVLESGEYLEDKKEGRWIEPDYGEIIYKNGLKTGKFIWSNNDKKIKLEDYRDDGIIKKEEIYYVSGKIRSVKFFYFNGENYIQNNIAIKSQGINKYLFTCYKNGEKICDWLEWTSTYEELIQTIKESEENIKIENN